VYEREFGPPGTPGPKVGVTVTSAMRNGETATDLIGTRIAFVDAQILEHNGLLVRNDFFIIHPFRVRLLPANSEEPLLDRVDYLDPNNPDMPEWEATALMLKRRQPTTFTSNSQQVADATGLESPANVALIANRLARREKLRELLGMTTDAVERAALESRIYELGIVEQWWNLSVGTMTDRPTDRRAKQLALQLSGYNIDMNGKPNVNKLGADEDYPWNIQFWMGGWDGDALCAYIQGTWTIPLRNAAVPAAG
jgi:hypothetical protein